MANSPSETPGTESAGIAFRLGPSLQSVGQAHDAIERFCLQQAIAAEDVGRVLVSLEEVITNAIRHGGATEIGVSADFSPGEIWIRVEDDGVAFNPLDRPEPDTTLRLQARPLGGLGIYLARKLMNEIGYERRNDRNHLTMRRHLA